MNAMEEATLSKKSANAQLVELQNRNIYDVRMIQSLLDAFSKPSFFIGFFSLQPVNVIFTLKSSLGFEESESTDGNQIADHWVSCDNTVIQLKQMTIDKGYAVGMTDALNFIYTMTPNREEINGAFRETKYAYPPTAIRETLANALIHQDFSATGTSVTVEIFDSRIEITNPGAPLVDIDRIIDNPPRSRNEKLARLMRHFNLCEELGTGWDKIVLATEKMQLPAPTMIRYEENTRVVLFSSRPFNMLTKEDKLHATYQHACVKYLQGDAMTNKSLRERFGLPDSASASISRLIKEAIKEERIKPYESQTSNKYLKYLPFWV